MIESQHDASTPLTVGYLVNQYPKISHSFVRREILALEALGVRVHRFSVRATAATDVVDEADRREREKTRVILSGTARLLAAGMRAALTRPGPFFRALALALHCGWRSDRGPIVHLAYLLEACALREWLAETGCAHLHAHFGTNPAMIAMLCRELGGPPFSFTAHGTEAFDTPQAIRLGEKVARAAFAVGVCAYGRSQLMRVSAPEHWPRIHIVRCGVDESLLEPAETPPGAVRLVCVARLSSEKGHLVLIDAAAQLARQRPDVEFVLVGDGELRPAIEARLRETGLHDNVTITGWADSERVRSEILASRALIVPSFAEGLPVVIMEALALRRPVIATNVGGIAELVETGTTGWLVPPGTADQLAMAMQQALEATPAQIEAMGEAGRRRIVECHIATTEAARLRERFAESIARRENG